MVDNDKETLMHLRVDETYYGKVHIDCYLTEGDKMSDKLSNRIYSALKQVEDDINGEIEDSVEPDDWARIWTWGRKY